MMLWDFSLINVLINKGVLSRKKSERLCQMLKFTSILNIKKINYSARGSQIFKYFVLTSVHQAFLKNTLKKIQIQNEEYQLAKLHYFLLIRPNFKSFQIAQKTDYNSGVLEGQSANNSRRIQLKIQVWPALTICIYNKENQFTLHLQIMSPRKSKCKKP